MNGYCITIHQPVTPGPYVWRVYDNHPTVHRVSELAFGDEVNPLRAYFAAKKWIEEQRTTEGE